MKIRIVQKKDVQQILQIYAPYVLNTNITFEYDVPSLKEMSLRIEKISKKYPYLVVEEDDEIIGYAYACTFHERKAYEWACELSIYVKESYHGKGIAKKLYLKLFAILQEMNIQTVYACITVPNDKSKRFHQALGFKQNALFHQCGYKFNKWLDVIWMEKSIGQYGQVDNFIPFSSLSIDKINKCLNN